MAQLALPFPRRFCRVQCERVDADGVLRQWSHVLDADTIHASIEHIIEAIPGVKVTIRKDDDGKPTRARSKGMRKTKSRDGAASSDPVR